MSKLGKGQEFDRIREIVSALGDAAGPIGNDTAPVPHGEGTLVVSTDASIEHRHFEREWLTSEEIGWRAAASALSDLAAAGAKPAGITVALGVVPGEQPEAIVSVMRGVAACARRANTQVLGGDLTLAPCWTIVVTVFGHVKKSISRAGAKPGDEIWVTGALGGARSALLAWNAGEEPNPAARAAFAHPIPRLACGEWLAAHSATSMMDISDGLVGDAEHIAAASGVQMNLDLNLVPFSDGVADAAERNNESVGQFAGTGGEDYELLVTLPANWDSAALLEADTGVPLTRIGHVSPGAGVVARFDGVVVPVEGFRHAL